MRKVEISLGDQRIVIANGYRLVIVDGDERWITCTRCGYTSHHPLDIAERYCVRCDIFHDDQCEDQHAP